VIARFVGVLALVCSVVLIGSPARADSLIGVSPDGRTWSASLPSPLFDAAERWVPGDVRSASFYVRNQAGDTGLLSLEAVTLDGDSLLQRDDIELEVRRDNGAWTRLPADGRSHRFPHAVLAPKVRTRIEVRADFLPSSPNRSQSSSLALHFTIGLVESTNQVADPNGSLGHHHGGVLPNTGGVAFWVLALAVVLLLCGGTFLIALRLTARREDPR
jgi:hypothetical protein